MTKKCLYFFLCLFVFQNAGHADATALRNVNQQYMALMLGSEGILPQKATPEQINQMIDGCITAGISDRLYHLDDKSALFKAQFSKFTGYKKLDVQLAYAFYMLGYGKFNSFEDITNHMVSEGCALEPNFIAEIATLSGQVFRGDIFEYRDRLEDVIKRASKPLRFDDFMEVVPERAPSPDPSGILSPLTTRSRSSVLTLKVKQNVRESDAYKDLISLGRTHQQIMQMLGQVVNEYTEEDTSIPPASLASLALPERYYTDAEITTLDPRVKNAYIKQREPNDEGILKTPLEVRKKIKSITQVDIAPKYEGE